MSENEIEQNQAPRKFSCWKIFVIFMVFATIIGGYISISIGLSVYNLWVKGSGYIKPSLEREFAPTAEYLLDNQIEDVYYHPYTLSISIHEIGYRKICINIYDVEQDEAGWTLSYSQIIINNQNVGIDEIDKGALDAFGARLNICVPNTLESGLHLIEFRAHNHETYNSFFGEPLFTHTWAIEVE